jgi:hypothetical protein
MKVIKHKDKWYLQSDTGYKEILLSTDDLLIKDGVQAIDDEFLEWFVNNPSCEEVKLENHVLELGYNHYKIIIQQEEPKQETMYSYDEVRRIAYNAYCFGQFEGTTEGKFNQWIVEFKK